MERAVRSKSTKGSKKKAKPVKASRKNSSVLQKKSPPLKKAAKNVTFLQDDGAVGLSVPRERPNGGGSPPSTRGLRQMSIKICEKVKESGKTTCNEVAEELLNLIGMEQGGEGGNKHSDDKNIRRRLYDALNVLDAVNVIEKDSKDITWKGMPDNQQQQSRRLAKEQDVYRKQMKEKEEAMCEQLIQHVTYRNLVRYNQRRHESPFVREADKIPVPFVIVNSPPYAEVHCDATRDMSQVMMDVNTPFALHDENAILGQLGFNQTSMAELRQMIPEDMLNYCLKQNLLRGILRGQKRDRQEEQAEPRAKRFRKAAPSKHV